MFLDGKEDSREGLKIPYLKVGINGATKSSSDVIIGLSFFMLEIGLQLYFSARAHFKMVFYNSKIQFGIKTPPTSGVVKARKAI